MRDYLTPGNTVPNTAVVVEYYSQALDAYYHVRADDEMHMDTGSRRLGAHGRALPRIHGAVSGAVGVCRFYRIPAYGDSHFYGLPTDCAAVTNSRRSSRAGCSSIPSPGNPTDFRVLHAGAADADVVPGNTAPVWRFFHSARTNHRFVTDLIIKAQLDADSGWADEGIRMCGPVGS